MKRAVPSQNEFQQDPSRAKMGHIISDILTWIQLRHASRKNGVAGGKKNKFT
eukprot:CAMPEP_0197250342 /NCGR_PEP_ID=MMETSP1429-20130617/52356_1 /TAXON_ID=49237 /ORGANISM="Chaetoceros  sp., Strain UNC1202" /LENGTH=51 /DNA_ID=CAMNT_0042712147 /DNA_START=38 /DNA_END=189 /DNA_ORIENTATION=+